MFSPQPLESHAEASSETAQVPNQSSAPVNKTSVPCYFYFNGFCNKGDRCTFLHGPDAGAPVGKSWKTDTPSLENKTSAGNGSGLAPAGTNKNLSDAVPKAKIDVRLQAKEDLRQSAPLSIPKQRNSAEISGSDYEQAAVVKTDPLIHGEGLIQTRSHLCADQSSEEQMEDHVEPEDRWESSPGFDVLVDNKSEDFEAPAEYDPVYPDAELIYERKIYDAYDQLDNELIFDDAGRASGRTREKMLDSIVSRKRKKLLPIELEVDGLNCMDLRDHLRKRREIDGSTARLSRRDESEYLLSRSRERDQRQGLSHRLHGRLSSDMGRNSIESLGDNGILSNDGRLHGWHNHSQSNRSRQRHREERLTRRPSYSSDISRKPVLRERRSAFEPSAFSGPKSLAQIKEEKKRAEDHGDYGTLGGGAAADFEGPKPLSEILKDKRRSNNVADDNTNGS